VFSTLMTDVLGYRRFAAQGGDWGAFVTTCLGAFHPERLAGIHLTLLAAGRDRTPDANQTEEEMAYLEEMRFWEREETGYQAIQGTRPQTLAFGLTDSPAGLAAWIVEKFRTWSDCDGEVERRFSKDQLLTNIMLYWVPETANSSCRLYCETMRAAKFPPTNFRVDVPTGCAIFPREIIRPPRRWVEKLYNVARWTPMPRGGHFAAMEEPALLADDVRAFFRDLR